MPDTDSVFGDLPGKFADFEKTFAVRYRNRNK